MDSFVLNSIFESFDVSSKPVSYEQCNIGHINTTYFVTCLDGSTYVLQKINTVAFKKPTELMDNIVSVTKHLAKKIEKEKGDVNREVLNFIPTKYRTYCHFTENNGVWRMYRKIEGARSYNSAEFDGLFENAGYAFGRFQHLLADFPAEKLNETIPHFHDTHSRFLDLRTSIRRNAAGRAVSCNEEIEFANKHEGITTWITDKIEKGEIPLRVTHNDTKLNNVLIDDKTHKGICVIDLDTVMPGSALYDFGDSIRFGASSAAEDEKDLSKVYMRLDLFEEFTRGYLTGLNGALKKAEIMALPMSAIIITFEIGMRFLADYLDGDIYFATKYPEHNLDRARTQFKLVADMESKLDEMNAIVKKYLKK